MVTLFDYQREAVEKLDSGSILCGGVGSGKSLTALYFYLEKECGVKFANGQMYAPMSIKPLYIITTARKRDTGEWQRECDRFNLDRMTNVVVDSWNNIAKYLKAEDAFFIFDEQRVVGSGAWVKSFIKITKKNRWILLSATPGDTWLDYIPVFVANGFYKNRTEFLARHAVYNRFSKYPKVDKFVEVGYLEKLRRKITVKMSFDRETVQHYSNITCSYDKVLYSQIAKDRWDPWKDEPIRDISQACYLMRKAANSDESRLRQVELLMAKHPKIIIFYNYDYELEMLRKLSIMRPTGEWNGHRHDDIPNTMEWLYFVQYTAGCEGWNCIETNAMIFFSRSYSYKQMTQAAGRIDRLNTPYRDLYYYEFETDSPIDRAIVHALRNKKNFNETRFALPLGFA